MASFKHTKPSVGFAARSFAVLVCAWQDATDYFTDGYRPELHPSVS